MRQKIEKITIIDWNKAWNCFQMDHIYNKGWITKLQILFNSPLKRLLFNSNYLIDKLKEKKGVYWLSTKWEECNQKEKENDPWMFVFVWS